MKAACTLLELVQGLLERTYRIDSGLAELAPFVIGDAGYRLLYATRPESRSVDERSGGARTLVRETAETVHARIYFPDSLIQRLVDSALNDALPALPIPSFELPSSVADCGLPAGSELGIRDPVLAREPQHFVLRGGFGVL